MSSILESLCRLVSLTENCFMCAFFYMSLSCHCRTLLPFACSHDSLSRSLSCTRVAIPTILNFEIRTALLLRPSSSAFTFCSCLLFDLASYLVVSGHASTQTCVCTDRPVYTSGGAILLSLSRASSTPGTVSSAAAHDPFFRVVSLHLASDLLVD